MPPSRAIANKANMCDQALICAIRAFAKPSHHLVSRKPSSQPKRWPYALAAAGAWLAFRALETAPPRLAPYMAATFSAIIALAFLNVDFVEMTPLTLIAVAVISTDVDARSQYRTTRPSAASLANL